MSTHFKLYGYLNPPRGGSPGPGIQSRKNLLANSKFVLNLQDSYIGLKKLKYIKTNIVKLGWKPAESAILKMTNFSLATGQEFVELLQI